MVPVIWMAACREEVEPTRLLQTSVDTIDGVEHVRNTGSPPAWRARPVAVLGIPPTSEQASAHDFGRIVGVLGGSDGLIYVADASVPGMRVFDEGGELVRSFGRRGSGPAEFRTLQSIGWLGDTLVVMDAGNARLGMLTPMGQWLGERTFRRMTGDVRLHQTAADELYSPHLAVINQRAATAFVRQTNTGPADTLVVPPFPSRRAAGVICSHNSGGGISFWTGSLAPRELRIPAPHGRLVDVHSADYRIAFLEPTGDTARVIERDVPRAPVSGADWANEQARYRKWQDGLPPSHCTPADPPRPEAKDLIRGVYFDDASRVWVERRTAGGVAFDVFNDLGRLLGAVNTPAHVENVAPYIRGDRLYLVTSDSLDVPYVRVFIIER